MRYLVMAFALYVQSGCAVQDWSVEDWDLYYRNCEVKLDWDEGEIECTWKV